MLTRTAFALLATRLDLLGSSASALFASKSLSSTYTVQRLGDVAVTYQVELSKPNKLRIESPAQLVVGDGTTIITFNKTEKSYDKRPQTDAEFKALFSSNETTLLSSFFDSSSTSRFSGVTAGGKKNRKGVTYDVVTANAGGKTFTFYIDPADKIAKIAEIAPPGGNLSETILVVTKEFQADPKLEDSRFAFTPPADATNVSADAPLKFPRDQMPNLYGWKILREVGDTSCCPTATADGLAWLSMNGFDALAPGGSPVDRAEWIARELVKYYKTDTTIGTTWHNMFAGLSAFLSDRGFRNSTLGFYSWVENTLWKAKQLGTEIPDLDVIKRAGTRDTFVMLALGWFNNPDASGKSPRSNWHWVTVVDANPQTGTITINDPYQASNPKGLSLNLRYTKLPASTNIVLAGSQQFNTKDKKAGGVPVLEKYPNVKPNQFAIVEGVLVVKVAR